MSPISQASAQQRAGRAGRTQPVSEKLENYKIIGIRLEMLDDDTCG